MKWKNILISTGSVWSPKEHFMDIAINLTGSLKVGNVLIS
jgi:hypothetical protein